VNHLRNKIKHFLAIWLNALLWRTNDCDRSTCDISVFGEKIVSCKSLELLKSCEIHIASYISIYILFRTNMTLSIWISLKRWGKPFITSVPKWNISQFFIFVCNNIKCFPGFKCSCDCVGWRNSWKNFPNEIFTLVVGKIFVLIVLWFLAYEVISSQISYAKG
jgi:hypothetical protein